MRLLKEAEDVYPLCFFFSRLRIENIWLEAKYRLYVKSEKLKGGRIYEFNKT